MLQEDAMWDENNNKKIIWGSLIYILTLYIPNSTYRLLRLHENLI